MVCGTAHAFLPDVYKIVPDAKEKILNIIEILKECLKIEHISKVLIIAAEGALMKSIYPKYLNSIECINPSEDYYQEIRYFIESVKCDSINIDVCQRFINFINEFDCKDIVLGCTEFPVLVDKIRNSQFSEQIDYYRFWNPLDLTIKKLKNTIK